MTYITYITYKYSITCWNQFEIQWHPATSPARGRFEVLLLRRAVEVRLDPWPQRPQSAASNQEKDTAMAELTEVRGPRMPQNAPEIRRHTVQTWLETHWNGLKMFETCLAHFFLWGCSQRSSRRLFVVYPCAFVFFWYISSVRSLCETNCRSHPLCKLWWYDGLWWHTIVPSSGRVLYINLKEHSLT